MSAIKMQLIDVEFYRHARLLASDMSDFLLLAAHQSSPEKALHFIDLAIENHNRVAEILRSARERTRGAAEH
jgi:hypothetical protein